jgi:hypothetical protein
LRFGWLRESRIIRFIEKSRTLNGKFNKLNRILSAQGRIGGGNVVVAGAQEASPCGNALT